MSIKRLALLGGFVLFAAVMLVLDLPRWLWILLVVAVLLFPVFRLMIAWGAEGSEAQSSLAARVPAPAGCPIVSRSWWW